jgi:hypothetical protein
MTGFGNFGLGKLEIALQGLAARREESKIWWFFVGSRVSGVFVG